MDEDELTPWEQGYIAGYESYHVDDPEPEAGISDYEEGFYSGWWAKDDGYSHEYKAYKEREMKTIIADTSDDVKFRQQCFQLAEKYKPRNVLDGPNGGQPEPINETIARAKALESYFKTGDVPQPTAVQG